MNEGLRQVLVVVAAAAGLGCFALIAMVVRDIWKEEKQNDKRKQ